MTQIYKGSEPNLMDMVASRFELVASMGEAETASVMFLTKMAASKLVSLHSHSDPECFYVLHGALDVCVLA